jgi:dTDP-4-dehydrorhamnose reductase
MLRLMKDRDAINVVSDQQGCPTYAADLAAAIMQIIQHPNPLSPGIYHYSNKGVINWYEFATAIRDLSASKCLVNPIPSAQYPTPAKAPGYSVMDTGKIRDTYQLEIPEWRDSLGKMPADLTEMIAFRGLG